MAVTALGLALLLAVGVLFLQNATAFTASSSSSSTSARGSPSMSAKAAASSSASASALAAMRQRAKAAIVGGFVADAATMPLHWIYDTDKIRSLLTDAQLPADRPEFFPKPACPFYQYPLGTLSPYGDEIVPLLRHLADPSSSSAFDGARFAQESAAFFKAYTGRLSHVPKTFLEAFEAGKRGEEAAVEDSQAHGIIKVPLLVGRYAGTPQLLPQVEAAVRVHQKGEQSVAASLLLARVLEAVVVEGVSTREAIEGLLKQKQKQGDGDGDGAGGPSLSAPQRALLEACLAAPYPRAETIKDFGWSCALPGALQGALYVAAHAPEYASGVRFSCLAGGDNCSRNIVVGALLAAQARKPAEAVPPEWTAQTTAFAEVDALADRIVAALE